MALETEMFYEKLAELTSVIGGDTELRGWFSGLVSMSVVDRTHAIQSMVSRMTEAHEDTHLTRVLALLADPRVLDAVDAALREHGF